MYTCIYTKVKLSYFTLPPLICNNNNHDQNHWSQQQRAPSRPRCGGSAVQGKQLLLYTSQSPKYLLVSLTCNRACSRSPALFLCPDVIVSLQIVMSSSMINSVLQSLWLFAISMACCKPFVLIWSRMAPKSCGTLEREREKKKKKIVWRVSLLVCALHYPSPTGRASCAVWVPLSQFQFDRNSSSPVSFPPASLSLAPSLCSSSLSVSLSLSVGMSVYVSASLFVCLFVSAALSPSPLSLFPSDIPSLSLSLSVSRSCQVFCSFCLLLFCPAK